MDVSIHVAVAENGVIGRDNGLPWKLSSDLRRFKASTMGNPVVMGRKTFESIGKPLPGRLNIVVTHDRDFRAAGAEVVHSIEEALALARIRARCMAGAREIAVIGGAAVYRQTIGLADRLHVTHVLAAVDGDAVFPPIDPTIWRQVHEEQCPAGDRDSHATRYAVYERRRTVHETV